MKTSAGLLVWRRTSGQLEVLLAHPGGPFFARRDDGSWSIPKGEYTEGAEEPLAAALREFAEEIGQPAPEGAYVDLGSARQSGKVNTIFAVEGDLDVSVVVSNTFSFHGRDYPEVDRAEWFPLEAGAVKLFSSQRVFLERLDAVLRTA